MPKGVGYGGLKRGKKKKDKHSKRKSVKIKRKRTPRRSVTLFSRTFEGGNP